MSTSPESSKSFRLPPPPRHQSPSRWRRRRRTITVRLGGRRGSWVRRAGKAFVRTLRRMKLRWMAAQYSRAVKAQSKFYARLLRNFVEGAAAMEAAQARILSPAYFFVPALPPVV